MLKDIDFEKMLLGKKLLSTWEALLSLKPRVIEYQRLAHLTVPGKALSQNRTGGARKKASDWSEGKERLKSASLRTDRKTEIQITLFPSKQLITSSSEESSPTTEVNTYMK